MTIELFPHIPPFPESSVPLKPEVLVPRLGDALIEKGLITQVDLDRALEYQSQQRYDGQTPLLGQVLVELGMIDQSDLDQAVTEQIMLLRAALEDSNRQLERRVEQRTAELKNALDKLAEMSQLKSNFIANISHELRTPLTHLTGYLDLLVSGELGGVTPDQNHALVIIQRAGYRLYRLIEDLILFSFSERGEVKILLEPVNLSIVCQTVVERNRALAAERNISLLLHCPTIMPPAMADQEMITWVIAQLVDNAIKFSNPNGRVKLEVMVEVAEIRVSVSDEGIGIPADRIEEIFQPFHQLDGSSTRRYGGTGLGLALARKIIESHGSNIEVESHLGEGSRFSFLLTAAPEGV